MEIGSPGTKVLVSNYDKDNYTAAPSRANPMGAYVAIAGIVLFTIAVFLDWLSIDSTVDTVGDQSVSGYETDPLIPFVAFLGLGLAAALLYAMARAFRRQHRGLTLTSMAAGIAATLLALAYVIDPPGLVERGTDISTEVGVYVALLGGLLWAVGSGLLAKEPEGDEANDFRRTTDGTAVL
jgi:O-antigen/teichoic acid export membrane protein